MARIRPSLRELSGPVLVGVAYYLGAEAAFLVGTLSDRIFAPFWPPNIILFCALLLAPRSHWWLYIAFAVPAHVVPNPRSECRRRSCAVAFVTNCLVAVLNALLVQRVAREAALAERLSQNASLHTDRRRRACRRSAALARAYVRILGDRIERRLLALWRAVVRVATRSAR